nr:MAG TPA: hypothetical protein [Caudoviricetes sp.]
MLLFFMVLSSCFGLMWFVLVCAFIILSIGLYVNR